MPNEELIRKVIKHIEANNRWDQAVWASVTDDMLFMNDDGDYVVRPDAWEGVPGYVYDYEECALIELGTVMEGSCSTKFCFAGHTVLQAGDKILLTKEGGDATGCMDSNGVIHNIEVRAMNLLGLTSRQASMLFDGEAGDKDLEKYKRLVTSVTGVTLGEEQANA